jgi:hypothetical protein
MSASNAASPIESVCVSAPRLRIALETLTGLLAPSASGDLTSIPAARRAVASALNELAQPPSRGPLLDTLLAAAGSLAGHPAGTLSPGEATPVAPAHSGWTGSVVHMLAAPAWQTPGLRPLGDQPAWLWPAYARYLFAAPAFFDTTENELRWSDHILVHLGALVRMLEGNRGSSSVKTIAQLAVNAADHWPAVGTGEHLRLRRHHVGRLLTLLAPRLPAFTPPPSLPSESSPLRIALIGDDSASAAGVLDATHLKTLLDPERLELTHFPHHELPADTAARVETLRAAQFDALIFAGDLTRTAGPLTALALHRAAPHQFATALCPHTSGLPEIDLFLGDALTAQESHSERVVVLPAALAFDSPAPVDEPAPTRADFGLPADAQLFVTTAHPAHTPAAVREHWTRLLAENPQARLILLPGTAGPDMDRFLGDCEHRFGDRIIIAGHTPLEPAALHALLRVCDGYLPSGAPGDRAVRDLAQRLGLAVPGAPARIDCLSFADALTSVIECACRTPHAPLVVPPVNDDVATRHNEGNHLLAFGRPDRAVVYLLAAVDDPQAGPEVWHDLALALHANQQPAEAIQAMETCVRLAPDRLDSWLQLADWATDYGHTELVGEIHEVVRTLAPADPRVTALAERIAV